MFNVYISYKSVVNLLIVFIWYIQLQLFVIFRVIPTASQSSIKIHVSNFIEWILLAGASEALKVLPVL